jgi:hypothetical protein
MDPVRLVLLLLLEGQLKGRRIPLMSSRIVQAPPPANTVVIMEPKPVRLLRPLTMA